MDRNNSYRSLFWPIILIGIGLLWLLANLGFFSFANLALLFRLWPLLLIAVGLDLLFARRSPLIGALIGLATLAVVVALILASPLLGLPDGSQVKTENFSEPVGGASSANVTVDLWSDPATLSSLSGSQDLIEVEATHTGQINIEASGEGEKSIRLSHSSGGVPFSWFDFGAGRKVDIRLNPDIPTDLTIEVGSGSAELDLRNLMLTGLEIDGGSG